MTIKPERFLEIHRKIRSKLCKEIFGHIMAVIVFSGLVIISIVEVLKGNNKKISNSADLKKLTAAILGICHFGLCATLILQLKYLGVVQMNPLKCKIWIYLEVYNIAATTVFILLATQSLLPAPFNQMTGTAFLLLVYWLPLIMFKTSQICRMLELVNILNFLLQENSMSTITTLSAKQYQQQSCCQEKTSYQQQQHRPHLHHQHLSDPIASTSLVTTSVGGNLPPPSQDISVTKPLSSSSPHIPFEWALIESMSSALP